MRRRRSIKPKATRVRVRNADEHIQGGSVRILEAKDLPTGCSYLRQGIPCTYRMTHVDVKVERKFVPEEEEMVSTIKLIGYCKSHRPKMGDRVFALPADLDRALNGPKNQKERMRRMENAMYVNVVPNGGTLRHLAERGSLSAEQGGWVNYVTTLCEKQLKKAYIPTLKEARNEYVKICKKCQGEKLTEDEKS